jgi:phage terminase small subunit
MPSEAGSILTPQQERFVAEYLIDLNATQAAIRAGYSAGTARQQASRLLSKVNVQSAIAEGKKRISDSLQSDAERVKQELDRIGFSDIRKLYDRDGNLRPIHELDDDTAAALSGIDIEVETSKDGTRTSTYKIKRYDKNSALTTLARWHGKLNDRVEHTGKDGGPIETKHVSDVDLCRRWLLLLRKAEIEASTTHKE